MELTPSLIGSFVRPFVLFVVLRVGLCSDHLCKSAAALRLAVKSESFSSRAYIRRGHIHVGTRAVEFGKKERRGEDYRSSGL